MLNELDESLKALLIQELPQVVERIEPDGFDIAFDVPNREFRSRINRPTLSLFLYNIQENRNLRGRTWETLRQNGNVTVRRPAVRLDCSYMVTAWSNEVEDEHRLLTGAARVLFRNPVLPEGVLQGGLATDDEIEITTEVAQPENFKDVVDIWSVLDNDLRPSVRVTVTIPLDVEVDYQRPSVHGKRVDMLDPSWRPAPTAPMRIEGRVEQDGRPVVGALVRADYSATTTDDRGEYALNNVTPGKQIVWVRVNDTFYQLVADLPTESTLQLPGAEAGGQGGGPDAGGGPGSSGEGTTAGPGVRRNRTSLRTRSDGQ